MSRRVLLALGLLLGPLAAACPLVAATLHVPGGYFTIQSALDAAVPGDTVLIAPGEYLETILVHADSVWLVGAEGPAATCLRGFSQTAIVIADSTAGGGIRGLNVRPPPGVVTNVHALPGSRVALLNLEIEGGAIGLRCQGADLEVTECLVRDCSIGISADGGAAPRFSFCAISDNRLGISASGDGTPLLRHCRMERNLFANLQVESYTGPAVIDAAENWWGVADEDGVLATIHNGVSGLGVSVIVDPWCVTPDCEALPTEPGTWGRVKSLFSVR